MTTEYQTFKVVKTDGSIQWGLGMGETEKCFVLGYPMSDGSFQSISIPWHRIDSIFSEDVEDAPWMNRQGTSLESIRG